MIHVRRACPLLSLRRDSAACTTDLSRRRDDGDPLRARGGSHADVVRHQLPELGSQECCRCKVDGIERTYVERKNGSRQRKNSIVDANELDTVEYFPTSQSGCGAPRQHRTPDFGAREGAGYQWSAPTKIS